MIITVHAWNTDKDNYSFDCTFNGELSEYYLHDEPIPVLLLVDGNAEWDQELENVYIVGCVDRDGYQHYDYELRPSCD